MRRVLIAAGIAAFGLTAAGVAAQQPTPPPVFAPAAATRAAQATAAAQASAGAVANVAAVASCPTGFVCVPFGQFTYPILPDCLDQHVITGSRMEIDPATGDDVTYVRNLVFLKAGADGWIIIPQPENKATGPDVGKPLGALLCAGREGAQ